MNATGLVAAWRCFTCGGIAAPFMTEFEVTFHCPGSMRFSAEAEAVSSGSEQSNIIPNLVIRPPFIDPVRCNDQDVNRHGYGLGCNDARRKTPGGFPPRVRLDRY